MQDDHDPPSVKLAQEYLAARTELRAAAARVEIARSRYESEREALAAWHQEAHQRRRDLEAALARESGAPANDVGETP